jgi:hypothetical protein
VDFNKIIARAKSLLLTPKAEWPVIAAEPATTQSLFMGYVVPMAALPALAGFIKSSLIGYGIPLVGGTYRASIGAGLSSAVLTFILSLVSVFVVGLIVDALAPTFGATKDRTQALKTTGFAYTASWVGGVLVIVPGIGWLAALLGGLYSIYLLYLALPHTMKAPEDKTVGYTVVTVIVAIVLGLVISAITGGLMGGAAMRGYGGAFGGLGSASISSDDGSRISGGALGGLAAFADKAEKASKEMEAAQKSGNTDAQAAAAGNLMATVLGGGDKVESLSTDRIKSFLPATLAGLKQESSSAERNGAMGMQVSEAKATYSDGNGKSIHLEVTDMGSAKGLMGLASWASIEEDKQTSTGYEKTYKQGDTMIHERWDNSSKDGEYSAMVGGRFMVKVEGAAGSINELKAALGSVDLAGLAALKNEGVKTAAN